MSVRLIVTDLDGTLLGADRQVSPRNRRALMACRDRGVRVVLASGRSFGSVRMIAVRTGLTDSLIISANGARMDDLAGGVTLLEDYIPAQTAFDAAGRLIRAGLYVECYSRAKIYMANRVGLKGRKHAPGMSETGDEFIDSAQLLLDEGVRGAYKLIVFSDDAQMLEESRRILNGLPLSLSSSGADNLEIMRGGAGKDTALHEYARRQGIAREEIMAFGDQTNDITMLKASGWPVAMGNAVADVKAVARLIAPHHDQSGVAQILEKYVLGDETYL